MTFACSLNFYFNYGNKELTVDWQGLVLGAAFKSQIEEERNRCNKYKGHMKNCIKVVVKRTSRALFGTMHE